MWLYVVYSPEPWAIQTWYPPPLFFQPEKMTVPLAAATIASPESPSMSRP